MNHTPRGMPLLSAWGALEHAVTADWNKGVMAIGGSTITQQLAKNLYQQRSLTWNDALRRRRSMTTKALHPFTASGSRRITW